MRDVGKFMSEEAEKLTPKEKAFVEYYLGEAKFNGAEAARRAGYSEKTAKEIASQNLTKLHVLAYMREIQASAGINEFQTLQELADVGYSPWKHHVQVIYDHEGNEKDCILQLRDKVKALEILSKIQRLNIDTHEITGKNGKPLEIATRVILPNDDNEEN